MHFTFVRRKGEGDYSDSKECLCKVDYFVVEHGVEVLIITCRRSKFRRGQLS